MREDSGIKNLGTMYWRKQTQRRWWHKRSDEEWCVVTMQLTRYALFPTLYPASNNKPPERFPFPYVISTSMMKEK